MSELVTSMATIRKKSSDNSRHDDNVVEDGTDESTTTTIRASQKLKVRITSHRTVSKNNETFTVYRIVTRQSRPISIRKRPTSPPRQQENVCEIERRYNDFAILHQELMSKKGVDGYMPTVTLPEFPPKRFNNMSQSVIAQRQKDLQAYLDRVISLPREYGKDTVEAFLGTRFSSSLDSDAMNPYGWANRTQTSGTMRTQYRRSSSHSGSLFEACALL